MAVAGKGAPAPQKTAAPTPTAAPTELATENFAAEVNLAGVPPATGARLDINRTYKVRTTKVVRNFKNDEKGKRFTYQFSGEVVEPESHAGRQYFKTVADFTNQKAWPFLVANLMSHGHARSALEKGKITLSAKAFVGRTAYLHVGALKPSPNGKSYPDMEFILPEAGEAALAREAARDAAGLGNGLDTGAAGAETPAATEESADPLFE